jgi:hypothetical protein
MELKPNCKHSYEDKKSSKHGTKSNCIGKEKEKRGGGLQILFGPPPSPPKGRMIFVDPFKRAIEREHFIGNVLGSPLRSLKVMLHYGIGPNRGPILRRNMASLGQAHHFVRW